MCMFYCSTQRGVVTMFPLIPLRAARICYCSEQNCTQTDDCAATIQHARKHFSYCVAMHPHSLDIILDRGIHNLQYFFFFIVPFYC